MIQWDVRRKLPHLTCVLIYSSSSHIVTAATSMDAFARPHERQTRPPSHALSVRRICTHDPSKLWYQLNSPLQLSPTNNSLNSPSRIIAYRSVDALNSVRAVDHGDKTYQQLPTESAVRARLEHVHGAACAEDCLAQAGKEGDLLHRALLGVGLTKYGRKYSRHVSYKNRMYMLYHRFTQTRRLRK